MSAFRPKPLVLALASALSAWAATAPAQAATVTWTGGGANTKWKTVANWDSNPALPGAADDAVIGAVATVLYDNTAPSATTVQSLTSQAAQFNFTGGTLVINGASFLDQLTQSGGLLDGAGTVGVAQAQINGGSFAGSGILELAAGGNHGFGGSGLNLDGGRVLRNAGTATFNSGASVNWAGNLNTGASQAGSGRFENTGTLNFTTYLNRSTTFSASYNGTTDSGSDASFDNSGTVNKTGPGSIIYSVKLNNTGTLNLSADTTYGNTYGGTQVGNGSTHGTGSYLTGTGKIMLSGGANTFQNGAVVDIAKLETFGTGGMTLESGADFRPGLFVQGASGGTTTVKAGAIFAPTSFEFTGGNLDFEASNRTLPDGSKLAGGYLRGTGTVTVKNATLGATSAKDAGTLLLAANSTHTLNAGFAADGGRVIRNAGTANFDAGANNVSVDLNSPLSVRQAGSGRFENAGTLNLITYLNRAISFVASNNGAADNGASASFDNTGTVKMTGDGSVTMGVRMNNRGTLNVAKAASGFNIYGMNFYGGLLDHQSGGVLTGTGSVLLRYNDVFRGGSKTNIEMIHVWGDTTIEDGAQFNPKNLRIRGGNYSVTKTGADSLVWNTNTLAADGTLNVAQNAPLVLAKGRLTGQGTVAMQNAATATTPTLVVKAGATLAPGITYDDNTDWTGATLSVTGGLVLETGSDFEVDLFYGGGALTNPLVAQDKLAVSGEATLAGQLIIELNPQLEAQNLQGRSFVILTSQRLYGQFDHVAGLGAWNNHGYAVEYFDSGDADAFADSVRITFNANPVSAPVPEPETWALMLAGLGLVGFAARRRRV